ncbi:unnamed protein product [Penicillium salamii]|nr:unnamed protein product [Penicillium salamii]
MSIGNVLDRREIELIFPRQHKSNLILVWLGILIIFLTGIAFILAILWVHYTSTVLAILAAVEDVNANYISLDDEGPKDPETGEPIDAKPITSGLRSSIRHLRARGGLRECFRGLRMSIDVGMAEFGIRCMMSLALPASMRSFLGFLVLDFIARMPLATWQMAWVHRVIADKSPQYRYRRFLGYQNWPRIAPAAALYNFAMSMTISLTPAVFIAIWSMLGIIRPFKDWELWQYIAFVLRILFGIALSVPAKIIFARVAASMLPEEDVPILPFDRSFGGKVAGLSGRGELGLLDAWTTFGWSARIRFAKILFKGLGIEIALVCIGFIFIIFGCWAISLI